MREDRQMQVVDAYAKVVVDESGLHSEIPVLLTDKGVVLPLLDCLLNKQTDHRVMWSVRRSFCFSSKGFINGLFNMLNS